MSVPLLKFHEPISSFGLSTRAEVSQTSTSAIINFVSASVRKSITLTHKCSHFLLDLARWFLEKQFLHCGVRLDRRSAHIVPWLHPLCNRLESKKMCLQSKTPKTILGFPAYYAILGYRAPYPHGRCFATRSSRLKTHNKESVKVKVKEMKVQTEKMKIEIEKKK